MKTRLIPNPISGELRILKLEAVPKEIDMLLGALLDAGYGSNLDAELDDVIRRHKAELTNENLKLLSGLFDELAPADTTGAFWDSEWGGWILGEGEEEVVWNGTPDSGPVYQEDDQISWRRLEPHPDSYYDSVTIMARGLFYFLERVERQLNQA